MFKRIPHIPEPGYHGDVQGYVDGTLRLDVIVNKNTTVLSKLHYTVMKIYRESRKGQTIVCKCTHRNQIKIVKLNLS